MINTFYFLILNSYLFILILTLLNLVIYSNSIILISLFIGVFINILIYLNHDKLTILFYTSKSARANKEIVKLINSYCVKHKLKKIKIYVSNILQNQMCFILGQRQNSTLIISKNLSEECINQKQIKTILDMIEKSSTYRSAITSSNNFLFFILIYPLFFLHRKIKTNATEYLIVMLTNVHSYLNSYLGEVNYELYLNNNLKEKILLNSSSIKINPSKSF